MLQDTICRRGNPHFRFHCLYDGNRITLANAGSVVNEPPLQNGRHRYADYFPPGFL